MKKLLLLFFTAVTVLSVKGQEVKQQEIQTLFSNQKSLGFYGSFSLGYSRIDGKDALVSGGRLGMIFNHSTAVGLAGYGFMNNLENYQWSDNNVLQYSLGGGYGGIFIEPIIGGLNPVHIAFPVMFGLGGIARLRNYGQGYWEYPYFDTPESDLFFIIEPAVELEANLARFFRTAVTISYRLTTDVELFDVTPDVLRGLHFGLVFKFGKF
ncbi:MAG: hypothetical protein ACOC10_09855 [Bacteroidota bacterium]